MSGAGPGATDPDLVAQLLAADVARGERVGLAVSAAGAGLATGAGTWALPADRVPSALAEVETRLRPRWVWWSAAATARGLVRAGLRPATSWDLAAVDRLLHATACDPARVWARTRGLDVAGIPRTGQLDLLADPLEPDPSQPGRQRSAGDDGDPRDPVRPDGHLRPDWAAGAWAASPQHLARWADLALAAAAAQERALAGLGASGDALATARAQSAAEVLCLELAEDGLPLDRAVAEDVLATYVGPRPADAAAEAAQRARRDAAVLACVPGAEAVDLRGPAQVRALLARVGVDVPDTRSWRLERYRGSHPLVDALLTWRRADRFATTYGYAWLDRHVGADGRLRGGWSGSDGAAGRMTAQAGLHNLPAELRPAVRAEPGHVLVRADLGQVEPRVLAAVSGDRALAAATRADDLYLPVAERLRCERAVAKVAVLAAMYGGTSGAAGEALRGLRSAYPVAMACLDAADERGRSGREVRTHGGRLVRAAPLDARASAPADERSRWAAEAARGRYLRNAVVQGAAAELFKAWAATVRSGLAALDASGRSRIVLCLHDELLLHVPEELAGDAARLLHEALTAAGRGWGAGEVRLLAEVGVVRRWSDAKVVPAPEARQR